MDGQIFLAALVVVAIVGVVTWLAISARQSRLRGFFRYVLLIVAISSTTLLIASAALYVVLSRGSSESPAAAVPLLLAFFCAVVAVPSWVGFVVQARYKSGAQPTNSSKEKS
jgi:hypothetical protein